MTENKKHKHHEEEEEMNLENMEAVTERAERRAALSLPPSAAATPGG